MSFRSPTSIRRRTRWKALSGFLVAAFVFGIPLAEIVPALSTVPVARAQQGTIPGGIAGQPQPLTCGAALGTGIMCTDWGQYNLTVGRIQREIDQNWMLAAFVSALNALTYFSQTIAYDTAEWAANGFEGQAPGIFTDKWDDYLAKLSLNAAGEFLGSFSEEFTQGAFGLDLCAPPNFPQLALEFQLSIPGLLGEVQRPKTRCEWTSVVQNWERAVQSLDNAQSLQNIRSNFTTGGNDISFGIGAHLAFFDYVASQREAGLQERLEGQGYKSVSNIITGEIETPAQLVKQSIQYDLVDFQGLSQQGQASILLNNAWNVGIPQLGIITASTFTNVLLSRLIGKLASGLFKSAGTSGTANLLDPFAAPPGSVNPDRIFASQFSDLITPRIIQTEAQDLLTELSACPPQARTKFNCAIEEFFASAIRQGGGLTVRQAIDQGFVSPEWELIPSTRVADNQDPSCYTRAFCVSNLRKLRLARVLPIGWELAADSPENQLRCADEGCLTLGEVIQQFQNCNDEGQLDAEHPFCHLIDPNWVLTILPAQCQVKGYGNQLISGTSQRLPECQDTTTCLRRDTDGRCVGGYGYCMAEQTFWQFDAPKCEAQFATCRTYTPRGGNARPISYLRSTLDYGSCNAGNVGCMWYALYRNPLEEDGWTASVTPATIPDGSAMDRVYFDATVEPCDASGDGCTALLRVEEGQGALNLIQNGSFEELDGNPAFPVGWEPAGGTPSVDYATPDVAEGSGFASVHGSESWSTGFAPGNVRGVEFIEAAPFRQYILSFSTRGFVNGDSGAEVFVQQYTEDGSVVTDDGTSYFQSAGCTVFGDTSRGVRLPSLEEAWNRFSCTFVTSAATRSLRIGIRANGSTDTLIDALQLEEADVARPFVDGVNRSLEQVNIKVPPADLQCSGASDDSALCANYAPVCRQNEAGCRGYRPTDGGGDAEIPAVLTSADRCPAACVGYSEYRKQASTFDLVRSPDPRVNDPDDDTAAFFVPSTGFSCAAQDVGCEVFTNLDAGAGDPSEQGYRYLRACVLPGGDTQTYYTWEGSDTSGYQLKTWSLQRDVNAPFPQGPATSTRPGPNGERKDPASCSPSTYLQALDPDCRQFYDPDGNVFYRFESQTILATNTCTQFRKERSTRADCEKTDGAFNPATGQCVYRADPGASAQCDATYAGCRAYVGTQGRAQEEVFYEEFTSDAFQVRASLEEGGSPTAAVALSDEALLVGDRSIRIQPVGSQNTIFAGPMPLTEGALYEVSFWARATTPQGGIITIRRSNGSQIATNASVTLAPEWRLYRMGPFPLPSDIVATGFLPLNIQGSPVTFIDKLRVERVQDVTYVVKDSWSTPAVCDQTPEGIPSPQAMLGCRAYTDRSGNQVTVRQFTRLCRETAIGCTAFVNTRNTVDPYRQNWEAPAPAPTGPNPERTSAFADRYDYYIDDQSFYCREEQLACRAFGRPNYTQDRRALDPDQPFTTVYFKDDPATYNDALCSEEELFCEAFNYATDKESGVSYFRAPSDHACEYRRATVVDPSSALDFDPTGRTYDGWFRVGTDIPCHPDFLQNGSVFGIRLTGDIGYNAWADEDNTAGTPPTYTAEAGYRGWAGTCPQEAGECIELRDVNDTSDPLHPAGRPYYVINNTQLDTESCDQVNPGDGCVIFRDSSNPNVDISTAATYNLYETRAYEPVDPVNCETRQDHPSCVATGGINDANEIIRVKPDRSCSAWLACSTAETVFDPQDGSYKSICSDLALCSQAGSPEGNSVPFCANYIDRSDSGETILNEYTVLTAEHYASRPVGFGAQDYSGVSIPDQFQVMDTSLVPLAAMLSQDAETQSRLAKDYRLAVGVPIEEAIRAVHGAYKALGAQRDLFLASLPPTLTEQEALALVDRVCVYKAPGTPTFIAPSDTDISFGLMTDDNKNLSSNGTICWLALDQGRPAQLTDIGGATLVSDNLNVPLLIAQLEQAVNGAHSQAVETSFPGAQCKAAPQADSPFDNRFVLEWDGTVTPPVPSRVRTGYGSINFCEFDEDCSCSYKRVEYGGASKFYEPLATDVMNAVCIGGTRHGQACVLHAAVAGSVASDQTVTVGEGDDTQQINLSAFLRGESANNAAADPCGGGGVCQPIQKVSLVRGVTGQCLQHDLSRPLTGSRSEYECLVWDPNPLFSGPSDPYHWNPTAGFQPPQSSGRYYCVSPYRPPQNIQFSPDAGISFRGTNISLNRGIGFKTNGVGTYAGQITRFEYRDAIASDKSCDPDSTLLDIVDPAGINDIVADIAGCDGNEANGSLDGARAAGTDMGYWCELVDDEGLGSANDLKAVRLITTGKGSGRGYAEYAVLADWEQVGQMIAGYPADAVSVDPEIVKEYALEDTIAGFTFSTPGEKLGCAYSQDWVEGVNVQDYDDVDIVKQQDAAWVAGFRQELSRNGGKLDRRNAQIVTENGSPEGIPVQVECLDPENSPTGLCYLKTWTLDYRAEGQTKFQAFTPEISRQSLESLSKAPVYGKCESSHSWFSIRAVFENTDVGENSKAPEAIRPETLVGPFRFVGFWVTACSPQSGPRYIYTRVNLDTADICRELAETISKDSGEATAFTDRNWAFGSYAVPKLGYQWENTNVPFGASLATRTAGEEPLYMSGVRQDQSNVLHPPTFTFSGQTYFRGEEYPRSNWGILSNIFARIYRIYTYNARAVTREDWACTNEESPNFGEWCPNLSQAGLAGTDEGEELSKKFCGYETECVPVGLSGNTIFSERVCNSFSGVNRGLNCSTDPDICHAGPATIRLDDVVVSQYAACEAQENWESVDDGRYWRCTGSSCPEECTAGNDPNNPNLGCPRRDAVSAGVFRCAAGSALANQPGNLSYCTNPSPTSPECPLAVAVPCVNESGSPTNGALGTCQGYPWAACRENRDCTFEAKHYWPAGGAVNNLIDYQNRFRSDGIVKYSSRFLEGSGHTTEANPDRIYFIGPRAYGDLGELNDCENETDLSTCLIRDAFTPAVGATGRGSEPWYIQNATPFFTQRIDGSIPQAGSGQRPPPRADDTRLLKLYPGFVPYIAQIVSTVNAGDAPKAVNYKHRLDGVTDVPLQTDQSLSAPFIFAAHIPPSGDDCANCNRPLQELEAQYGACESKALMFTDGSVGTGGGNRIGLCRGGARSGALCYGKEDCIPEGVDPNAGGNWCNPVTSGPGGNPAYGFDSRSAGCWPNGPSDATAENAPSNELYDEATDSNICTRPVGYWPRANLCTDPTDEYCGLLWYDLQRPTRSINDNAPLPTDVTSGLYTPAHDPLHVNRIDDPERTGLSSNNQDYTYVDFYNPIPPTIAAPDMRTCQGGTCKISALGAFSIDTVNGGRVNGGAGSHIASLRFYAWASHEQMPLRRLVIDWGDGQQTELPDAFLKNHKPFCETQKECATDSRTSSGITCQADSDCPPGTGQCVARGSCASGPNAGQACIRDQQCDSSAGGDGVCQPRLFFGNDGDACEEQFFEFRHVYTCGAQNQPSAACAVDAEGTLIGRCSGDQTKTCSLNAAGNTIGCAEGDTCRQDMVQIDGCFDQTSAICRFTPRILVVDNWGWCAGECRADRNSQGLTDAPNAQVLHPNGGCYDASRLRSNIAPQNIIGQNECAVSLPAGSLTDPLGRTWRPWTIFPGSVQVQVGATE